MNEKILIVDDEKEYIRTAMSYIIEESVPYALLCAPNGKKGIEVAEKELPNVIIMDWEMPEMNGIDAIQELKKNELTKDIPVIIATGIRLTNLDLRLAFKAGASDFIRKPLDKTEFISRIASHLKMADYITRIKQKNECIVNLKIECLNKEIEAMKAKKENDKALFMYFSDTLKSVLNKLDAIRIVNTNTCEEIETICIKLKQSINYFSNQHKANVDKPDETFVKNLLSKTENLTTGEIQLCHMLKNKLSTKDIATITFREHSSVKVARSRLRKKIGLKETENLVTFLEQF